MPPMPSLIGLVSLNMQYLLQVMKLFEVKYTYRQTDPHEVLSWKVPFSVRVAEMKGEMVKYFHPVALLRILIVTLIVCVGAELWLEQKFSGLDLDWRVLFLKAFGFGLLVVTTCMVPLLIPSSISVSKDRVIIQGSNAVMYRFDDLCECRLTEVDDQLYLSLKRTNRRSGVKFFVPEAVDRGQLRDHLNRYALPSVY